MTSQTKAEIQRCQEFLNRADISEADREAAHRGLNDWFCQALFDEGLMMSGLYQDSGHATPDGRRVEANKLIKIIEGYGIELTPKETAFVEQMADSEYVSPKQLFWLRDIRDKYL